MQIAIKPWTWFRVLASTIWGLLSIGSVLMLAAVAMMLPEMLASGPLDGLATVLLGLSALIPPYMFYLRVFPRNFDCMKYVGKDMPYKELRRQIGSEVFREPFALCDRKGRRRESRILFSDAWIVIEGTDGDPICIPRDRVGAIGVFDALGANLGDLPPVGEKYFMRIVLDDDAGAETVLYIDGKDYERVCAFLESEFVEGDEGV